MVGWVAGGQGESLVVGAWLEVPWVAVSQAGPWAGALRGVPGEGFVLVVVT